MVIQNLNILNENNQIEKMFEVCRRNRAIFRKVKHKTNSWKSVHCKLWQINCRQTKVFVCKLLDFCYNYRQLLHRQMTVYITHDCIWILNADKHLRILQSKHLQCRGYLKVLNPWPFQWDDNNTGRWKVWPI